MMKRDDLQLLAFQIIGIAGDAQSFYFEALEKAKQGNFPECDALLEKGDAQMQEAHHRQTELLSEECNGVSFDVSLIMVHAQDHLMNAVLSKKLIREMIDILRRIPADYQNVQ